jgi:hypothetical protein
MSVLPFQKATAYDTGAPVFDPNATMQSGQQTQLGALGLQLQQIKAQRAQSDYKLQQEMLASMTPQQRLAFSFAPEKAGEQLSKQLFPERKWTAIAKDGSAINEQNQIVGGQEPIVWGEGPPGAGANLANALPPAPPAQSSQTFAPGATGAPADLTGRAIRSQETGGNPNPNTAANPNSTARGPDQFIASTWLDQLARNAPEVVAATVGANANLKDPAVQAKLLALREKPELNTRLTTSLAQENGAELQKNGLEATPRNLVLAHFLGASGAARMLKGAPGDPAIKHASTEAVGANQSRFFDPKTGKPRTVAEILAMADQRVAGAQGGATPPNGQATPAQTAVAPPAQQPGGQPGGQGGWVTATRGGLPITAGNKPGEYWQRRQIGATPAGKPMYEYRTAPGGNGGPYDGTGDGQYWNQLLTGDPSTPAYAAAYHQLTKPQYFQVSDPNNPEILVTKEHRPQLPPNIRLPTYQPGGAAAAQPPAAVPPVDPNATPPAPGATPAPPASVPPAPQPAVAGTGSATEIPGTAKAPGQTSADKQKLQSAEVEFAKITSAIQSYRQVIKETGANTWSGATPFPTEAATKMNTAYNNVALLAKGEELYNLGVLNGPDLDIIRRTLADPSTFKGVTSSVKELNGQIDMVEKILNKAMEAARKQYGPKPLPGAKGGPSETVLRFDGEGNPL